jgi:hypothetical protein
MKVEQEIFQSGSELALQDLLIDAAAVVAAAGPDRTGNGNDPRTQCGVSRNFAP